MATEKVLVNDLLIENESFNAIRLVSSCKKIEIRAQASIETPYQIIFLRVFCILFFDKKSIARPAGQKKELRSLSENRLNTLHRR